MRSFLESLDVYDKSCDRNLVEHTLTGKRLTLIFSVVTLLAVTGQIIASLNPTLYRDLDVDSDFIDGSEVVNISLDMTVDLPCYYLHLDVLDTLGSAQLDLRSTVKFIRVSSNGTELGISNETIKDLCYPCYGALPDDYCCNSCEQIKLLLMATNTNIDKKDLIQCQLNPTESISFDEKCRIKGKLTANRVEGSFHVCPGRNKPGGSHSHDINFNILHWEVSHVIRRLQFGYVKKAVPMKKMKAMFRQDSVMKHVYHLMVVPVIYKKGGVIVRSGYEMAAAAAHVPLGDYAQMPGVFFDYKFTPYRVIVTVKTFSLASFLTSCAGFLAGLYAIASLSEAFILNSQIYHVK